MKYLINLINFFLLCCCIFASIKCPNCGFQNSDEDNYCLECASKIANNTSSAPTYTNKNIAFDAYTKAFSKFKIAEKTNDIKKAISLYNQALLLSSKAIRLGKPFFTLDELQKITLINEKAKLELSKLRKDVKYSRKHIPLKKPLGSHAYYVKTTLNGKVTTLLHVDSGCSELLISTKLAKKLGIKGGRDVKYRIANGSLIKAKRVILKSVEVGGFTIKNVPTGIHDTAGNGLLGMAFLKHFKHSIDTDNQTLTLEPKR